MNTKIIDAARRMIGTPFVHQGRIPGVALDCAGLVIAVAREIGAPHFDVPGYGRNPSAGIMKATLDAQPCLVPVVAGDMQPGDVLLMRFATEPQHVAILAGETIIHSYMQVGKVCEHRLSDVWQSRIVAAYRFRGAE